MTMIAHASIPADDTRKAAAVLAEMMQGEALPFPPAGPNGWKIWSGDGDIDLEVVPRGAMIHDEGTQANWRAGGTGSRLSEVHLAVCVNRPESEIIAIAEKAGWPARHCDRGGGFFGLVEVWVEGCFLIEFLDPAQARQYKERVTAAGWKKKLAEMGVA
jgi:hypothetical protein